MELASSYRQQQILAADGAERIVLLYEGAIAFLHRALGHLESGDIEARVRAVDRVLQITGYLRGILDRERGREAAQALERYYGTVDALLLQGSALRSPAHFEQALDMLRAVRDAWKQALHDAPPARSPHRTGSSGVDPAVRDGGGTWNA